VARLRQRIDRYAARAKGSARSWVAEACGDRSEKGDPERADRLAFGHAPRVVAIAPGQIEPLQKLTAKSGRGAFEDFDGDVTEISPRGEVAPR